MTRKVDFNAEEWSTVVEGPVLGGMRVVTASRGGTIRESIAMGQVYAKARQEQGQSELLDELVDSPPAIDADRVRQAGDVASATRDRLREAVALVDSKASPEETEAYKRFVLLVAETVANAHREGGILGIGGKQVSDEEQEAIDDIATTLGLDASDGGARG